MPISILVVQNPLKVKELVRVHYGQLCGCDGTEYIPALEAGFYEFKSRRPYPPNVACPVGRGSGLENRWW